MRSIVEHNHVQILASDESAVPIESPARPRVTVGSALRPRARRPMCSQSLRVPTFVRRGDSRCSLVRSCLHAVLFRYQRRMRDPRARGQGLADSINQPSLDKRIVIKLVGGLAI